ncbi:MAG: hypothetical protein LBH34_00730 [Prevotellaceae bacterium]|jgi:hypothetical protein|nr:hypothetical protein [Prevotellaceae bacterium]
MIHIKKITLVVIATTLSASIFAQNEVDALRFSRNFNLGTARSAAMGGAFTALGGDASSLASNPAGIGVYRSSDLTITGNLMQAGVNSSYMGNSYDDSRTRFGLSNLGIIGTYNLYNDDGLVNLNFGFTHDKLANFNERYEYVGSSIDANTGTYLDYFTSIVKDDVAKGFVDLSLEGYMAVELGLTNYINDDTIYSNLDGASRTKNGKKSVTSGNIGEYGFNFGGNVSNIFYFGVRVGLQSVSFSQTTLDEEWNEKRDTAGLNEFYYKRDYRVDGIGVNFKVGFIVWPFIKSDIPLAGLRIGAAIHTPTYLSIDDKYELYADSKLFGDNLTYFYEYVEDLEYNLETPLKILAGAAYVFGHQDSDWRGILSLDYEYLDYSKIKTRKDGERVGQNLKMDSYFNSASNFRLGGELGYRNVSFRAGYGLYGNPYKDIPENEGRDGKVNVYSGGIGVQVSEMFNLAFAYQRVTQKDKGYLYNNDIVKSNPVNYEIAQNNFFITFGWRF